MITFHLKDCDSVLRVTPTVPLSPTTCSSFCFQNELSKLKIWLVTPMIQNPSAISQPSRPRAAGPFLPLHPQRSNLAPCTSLRVRPPCAPLLRPLTFLGPRPAVGTCPGEGSSQSTSSRSLQNPFLSSKQSANFVFNSIIYKCSPKCKRNVASSKDVLQKAHRRIGGASQAPGRRAPAAFGPGRRGSAARLGCSRALPAGPPAHPPPPGRTREVSVPDAPGPRRPSPSPEPWLCPGRSARGARAAPSRRLTPSGARRQGRPQPLGGR